VKKSGEKREEVREKRIRKRRKEITGEK